MRLGEHGLIRHRKSSQRGTFARKPSLFPEQRTMKQEACWVTNRNPAPSGAGGCQFYNPFLSNRHSTMEKQKDFSNRQKSSIIVNQNLFFCVSVEIDILATNGVVGETFASHTCWFEHITAIENNRLIK